MMNDQLKSKQAALRLLKQAMEAAGDWRHDDALQLTDEALAMLPPGRFAVMAWDLRANLLRQLRRDAEADAAVIQARQAARPVKRTE